LRESKYGVIDEADQFGNCAFLVWAQPVKHLVQNDAQRPDVSANIINESLEDLRCHVDGRPHHRLRHVALFQQLLAEAEVCQLDNSIVEEDIGGFQIPVQDVF